MTTPSSFEDKLFRSVTPCSLINTSQIFRGSNNLHHLPFWEMQQVLLKRQDIFTRLHDVTPLRTVVFIGAAVGDGTLKPPKWVFVRFKYMQSSSVCLTFWNILYLKSLALLLRMCYVTFVTAGRFSGIWFRFQPRLVAALSSGWRRILNR